jgi:hypothetical protein
VTAPEISLPAGDHPRRGGDSNSARFETCPTCYRPMSRARICECDHVEVLHNLAGDKQTRTACSHSEGAKCTPCGCRAFTPQTPAQENPS